MLLAFKIKHTYNFSAELSKARQIAKIAINTRTDSSKDVRHIGLPSTIANQILRKYGGNCKAKKISSIKLIVPGQSINVNKEERIIKIPSLNASFMYYFKNDFEKINQVEADDRFFYVSASFKEEPLFEPKGWLGMDLNTSGHSIVMANPVTGKVLKFGKNFSHIRMKYLNIRKNIQKSGKFSLLKKIRGREPRIIRDLNHKISRKIVDYAKSAQFGIRFENLKGITERGRRQRRQRHILHAWPFYQLQKMVEYKAKLKGVPIEFVPAFHTSATCSRCGAEGKREQKKFSCLLCGHVDNADANAAFNIAKGQTGMYQLRADRDARKGNTGIPKEAIVRMPPTSKFQCAGS